MKKREKKLQLHRETLRHLADQELKNAAGGTSEIPCTHFCTRFTDCCTAGCTDTC